jgi:hypothetical protein
MMKRMFGRRHDGRAGQALTAKGKPNAANPADLTKARLLMSLRFGL